MHPIKQRLKHFYKHINLNYDKIKLQAFIKNENPDFINYDIKKVQLKMFLKIAKAPNHSSYPGMEFLKCRAEKQKDCSQICHSDLLE